MKKLFNLLLITGLLAVGLACEEDEANPQDYDVAETVVVQAEIPTTATVNELLTLNLWFPGGGCYSFDRSEINRDGNAIEISLFSRTSRKPCTYEAGYELANVKLMFDEPGAYTVRIKGWNIPSEYTVVVD